MLIFRILFIEWAKNDAPIYTYAEAKRKGASERQSNRDKVCACVCGVRMTTNGKNMLCVDAAKSWDSSQMISLATVYKSNNHTIFPRVLLLQHTYAYARAHTLFVFDSVPFQIVFRFVCETIT